MQIISETLSTYMFCRAPLTDGSRQGKENMMSKQMIIGMHLGNGYGNLPGAWRASTVDPRSYTSFDAKVRHAQAAERGKLQFLFLPDGPTHVGDIENEPPNFNLDVMVTLAAVACATDRIGLVATGSTTFNEPFNLARQFKALDVLSHGRTGWNAVTSSGEDVAANYGSRLPSSKDRYGRAHETVQLVQALWGSWGQDAWLHDQAIGRFANAEQIAPINMGGSFVASRGPLYIPRPNRDNRSSSTLAAVQTPLNSPVVMPTASLVPHSQSKTHVGSAQRFVTRLNVLGAARTRSNFLPAL